MQSQQAQQLAVRVLAALQCAADATSAQEYSAAVTHAAGLRTVLQSSAGKQAMLARGLPEALPATLAAGLRMLLRTRAATSCSLFGGLCLAVVNQYEWLLGWMEHCRQIPGQTLTFVLEVATKELTALVAPACQHLTHQLHHLQQQHSLEQQPEQHRLARKKQGKKKDEHDTADALLCCFVLISKLLHVHAQLSTAQSINSLGSSDSAANPTAPPEPGSAVQFLAAAAPLAAAALRGSYQWQASSSGSGSSSGRSGRGGLALGPHSAQELPADIASIPATVLSAFTAATAGGEHAGELGPVHQAVLETLLHAAPDVPMLLAIGLATATAAAYERAAGKASFALPAAVSSSSSASSSSSRRRPAGKANAVPPHHVQLLAALGVPAWVAAHTSKNYDEAIQGLVSGLAHQVAVAAVAAGEARSSSSSSSSGGARGSGGAAPSAACGAALPVSALSLLRLDAHQLACICATAAEAAVLLPDADVARWVPLLLDGWQETMAAQSHASAGAAAAAGTAAVDADATSASASGAAVEPAPDALTLVVQLVMPTALHMTAQAADPAASSRDAWTYMAPVMHNALACGSVFDGAAFQQHPTAVLAAFEAATRALAADDASAPTRKDFFLLLVRELEQALLPGSFALTARLAAAASEPGPARALLYLLTSCVKALAADWSGRAAGGPEAAAQGDAMAAAGTALTIFAMANEAQCSILDGCRDSSGSFSADLQQLLDGFGHVTGKALFTAGAVLSAALPAQLADTRSAEEGMAAAAALPWRNQTPSDPMPLAMLQRLRQFEPAGCAGSTEQQLLLERFSTLKHAMTAVLSLGTRLAQQAPEAEAAAAVEAATAEWRGMMGDAAGDTARSAVCSLLVNTAQVELLLATHAEGRRLADALTSCGTALCAALPSKFACNDPACSSCDQPSEQQLVSGKGSVCSGCRVARFCCVEHHHRSWPAHKRACRALAAGGSAGKAKAKAKRAQA